MKFIKLSTIEGTIVIVNPEKIEAFYRVSSDTTDILMSSGSVIHVKELPEEIETKIKYMGI